MTTTTETENKELVLEAFDALFNQRDYAKAERYWSPDYIQHSAHIAPGRRRAFRPDRTARPSLRYEHGPDHGRGRLRDDPRPLLGHTVR